MLLSPPTAFRPLVAFAMFLAIAGAHAETITGRAVAVLDGDTIVVLDGMHQQHRVRLAQIDAPEIGHGRNRPGQAFGQRSKQSLSDLVYGKDVRADCEDRDRYNRQVCTVRVGTLDTNIEQVRHGMAWVYRKYARDPAYFRAEEAARASRIGLWADARPVPPWDWRHSAEDREERR